MRARRRPVRRMRGWNTTSCGMAAKDSAGISSVRVGPPCSTCGGFGMWVEQRGAGQDPLVRICYDCPAFYTKGKRP
jgi:hypothetical protein